MRRALWSFFLILPLFPTCFKNEHTVQFKHVKPAVPKPVSAHPWIATQAGAKIVPEMVRDLEKVEAYTADQKEESLSILIRTLLALQAEVPFHFPDELYNVLYITEQPHKKGYPIHRIIKRVYFGDTDLGMPMYLDVRVFDVDQSEISSIIETHFKSIDGEFAPCGEGFIGKGIYANEDSSHGFAKERAVFIYPHIAGERLFLMYSDVPVENETALRDVAKRCYLERD